MLRHLKLSKITHQMSVTDLQCLVNTIPDLTWTGLPGAISQLTVNSVLIEIVAMRLLRLTESYGRC